MDREGGDRRRPELRGLVARATCPRASRGIKSWEGKGQSPLQLRNQGGLGGRAHFSGQDGPFPSEPTVDAALSDPPSNTASRSRRSCTTGDFSFLVCHVGMVTIPLHSVAEKLS